MKTYQCQCGTRLHFENSLCLSCQHELGFLPDDRVLSTLSPESKGVWRAYSNDRLYRKCNNYARHRVCNWMVPIEDNHEFCFSCRLSEIIPDLSKPQNILLWRRIEQAKRRLLYSLMWFELPIIDRKQDPEHGLAFHLKEDQGYSEFAQLKPMSKRVITGHACGVITLNIAEADPVFRERHRTRMQENYRTLLGHFRHESAHYYWDLLLRNSNLLGDFRALFGDEREDYDAALSRYYENGPQANWEFSWISAYASAHPWEDWAETWAHYLHMVDTLETASDYGFELGNCDDNPVRHQQFHAEYLASISIQHLVNEWSDLSVALNDLNRSMGLADAYPFVLSDTITEKLAFVHRVITRQY